MLLQRTTLQQQPFEFDCILARFRLLESTDKREPVQCHFVPTCRLLTSIDEDDWVKYFSQVPLFSLDSALFCPYDPVFQLQQKFAAEVADPFGWNLDLPLKILPLFG